MAAMTMVILAIGFLVFLALLALLQLAIWKGGRKLKIIGSILGLLFGLACLGLLMINFMMAIDQAFTQEHVNRTLRLNDESLRMMYEQLENGDTERVLSAIESYREDQQAEGRWRYYRGINSLWRSLQETELGIK